MMKEFWNDRYRAEEYVYGTEPNAFFRKFVDTNHPCKLLLPGEGEGRNAVYAAIKGWQADAFDQSDIARDKALKLAHQFGVTIQYHVADIHSFDQYFSGLYDAIASIFLHLNPVERIVFHKKLQDVLKPGGKILLVSFSRDQLEFRTGGPQQPELLFTFADLTNDFGGMDIQLLEQKEISMYEGPYHQGTASVIHLIATKRK